jgi:hypothetical protein
MDTAVNDLAASIRDVTVSGGASGGRGHESLHPTYSNLALLKQSIQKFSQSTEAIASQARSVESLADNVNNFDHHSIADVFLLIEQTKKLTDIAESLRANVEALTKSTERCIIRQLSSFGNKSATVTLGGTPIQNLLSHFDADIKAIIRTIINTNSDQSVLWRVAVECYQQAAKPSGPLHVDNYLIPLEEARTQRPYDRDFESEEYYEHQNRIDVDERYATAYRAQAERNSMRKSEARKRDIKRWLDFWISALTQSPNGPTLFYPSPDLHDNSLIMDVPRYLFRTFDADSSGINDASVIASTVSKYHPEQNIRNDILGMEKQTAAKLLHAHLVKPCFSGERRDNLMSWTSSLLFAIQYAIWRAHKRRRPTSEVKICAVDTSEFPLGQFMRDITLLDAYRAAAEEAGGDMSQFFQFRLNREEYYNGEHLSQGRLDHAGRSCMMSLEQLIRAGLYQLYPEFNDEARRDEWTKRVRELRSNWAADQVTTDRDIELALAVGQKCFGHFELCDIASLILTLKNRQMSEVRYTSE